MPSGNAKEGVSPTPNLPLDMVVLNSGCRGRSTGSEEAKLPLKKLSGEPRFSIQKWLRRQRISTHKMVVQIDC